MILDFGSDAVLDFFDKLYKNKVAYLLIGGWAVNYHGYSRATQDIDLWLAPNNTNRDNFCKTLLEIGYTNDEINDIQEQDFTLHFKCSVWLEDNTTVDCLTVVHRSLDFDLAFANGNTINLNDVVKAFIVDYTFLREMKLRSHRPKDMEDVSKLDHIKNL